jgi:N-acetylglucosaminyldiphosphoundecaprenol N-acetyl-beta-D-mannosaminyltransferase
MRQPDGREQVAILGATVDRVDMQGLNDFISHVIPTKKNALIGNHNLHSIYLCGGDDKMRRFYDTCSLVHVDGMSLVMASRLLGGRLTREERVAYIDWLPSLFAQAEARGWKIFFLGSEPGVAEKAVDHFKNTYPELQIESRHGYFDCSPGSAENAEVLATIAASEPDLLLVGMGMPRQEHWVLDNLEHLEVGAILTGGACMDYFAGTKATPPRWLGRFGLEWAFRLAAEPSRLWRRYLLEPWVLFFRVLRTAGGAGGVGSPVASDE